jgi:hypothetical protein
MKKNGKRVERDQNLRSGVALAFAFVVGAWIVFWHCMPLYIHDWEHRGQFGDQFGALNTLFSGLAFAGVIVAIFLQRRDLELQQQELERVKDAEQESRLMLEKQIGVMERTARINAEGALISAYAASIEGLPTIVQQMSAGVAFRRLHEHAEKLMELADAEGAGAEPSPG